MICLFTDLCLVVQVWWPPMLGLAFRVCLMGMAAPLSFRFPRPWVLTRIQTLCLWPIKGRKLFVRSALNVLQTWRFENVVFVFISPLSPSGFVTTLLVNPSRSYFASVLLWSASMLFVSNRNSITFFTLTNRKQESIRALSFLIPSFDFLSHMLFFFSLTGCFSFCFSFPSLSLHFFPSFSVD